MRMKKMRYLTGVVAAMLIFSGSVAAGGVTYTYDNLDRLRKADYGNGRSVEYAYDAAGNIAGTIRTGTTSSTTTTSIPPDTDLDGIADAVDNCPAVYNPQQLDADLDGVGDCCDSTSGCGGCGQPVCDQQCSQLISPDTDLDGIADAVDNCPSGYNPQQLDADLDGVGDCCDSTPGCGGCGQPACDQPCVL